MEAQEMELTRWEQQAVTAVHQMAAAVVVEIPEELEEWEMVRAKMVKHLWEQQAVMGVPVV